MAKRYAAIFGAVILLNIPGLVLPWLFPGYFHLRPLRLLGALMATMPITMPVLLRARKYFMTGR
jgi:hypothetical protein